MTRPRPSADRERLGELFERIVRLPDDERDAFLKEACGDDPALPAALERVAELAMKAFTLNPHSARGHWLKAFVAFQRGDLEEAIRGGSRALTLSPDDPDTLLLLGAHVCPAVRRGSWRPGAGRRSVSGYRVRLLGGLLRLLPAR